MNILNLHEKHYKPYTIARMIGLKESTVASFIKTWEQTHKFSQQMGRPKHDNTSLIKLVELQTLQEPLSPLRTIAVRIDAPKEAVRLARKAAGIHYFQRRPRCPLTEQHQSQRVAFALSELERQEVDTRVLCFTDESTVDVGIERRGIWRRRGFIPEEGFYERKAHPLSVMVWGLIASDGYKSKLLRCPPRLNKETYLNMILESGVLEELNHRFGEHGYVFQQDNASCHSASADTLGMAVFLMPSWPPHSPDLSPIEMVWAIIKRKLEGRKFRNADELYAAISAAWDEIPAEEIINLVSSFPARLQTVRDIQGKSLNGHWKQVHEYHHPLFGPAPNPERQN